MNIVTKSGTNDFHGSLFEFFRNNKLDARNFFNPDSDPQTQFRNNQFGGAIGGPIKRNQTFFFFAYEGQRERVGLNSDCTCARSARDLQRLVVQQIPSLHVC